MSMNKVKLSQIVNDFIITSDGDDYINNVSDVAIRNFALRGTSTPSNNSGRNRF